MAPQLEINGEVVSPGTELVLENGETFIFREVLGAGFHAIVIRTLDDRVLRLVRHIDVRTLEMQSYFLEAALLLASVVDPKFIVQISDSQFRSDYVTTVEMLAVEQTLDIFLHERIDYTDIKYKELLHFFSAFRRVETLGSDFLPKQIGYVRNRGWVLVDYGPGVKILKPGERSNHPLNLINRWFLNNGPDGLQSDVVERLKNDLRKNEQENNEIDHSSRKQGAALQCKNVFI